MSLVRGLFGPPDVEKLKAKEDVQGLVKALAYPKDAQVRRAAAEALGQLREECALQALEAALGDPEPAVRQSAVWAIAAFGESAVSLLIGMLHNEKVGEDAADALGKMGKSVQDGALYRQLVQALVEHGPLRSVLDSHRERAVEALKSACDGRAVEPLLAALQHQHGAVRSAVSWALADLYRGGSLDEQARLRILAQREALLRLHYDGGHYDMMAPCGHQDEQLSHDDRGFGAGDLLTE